MSSNQGLGLGDSVHRKEKSLRRNHSPQGFFFWLSNTIHYWGYSMYDEAHVRYNHTGDTRRINWSVAWHLGGRLTPAKLRKLKEENWIN